MTEELFLEFDEFKLALLRREAFDLDLTLEAYLSEMIEDMISFNSPKTEDEENMDKYKTVKWKDREIESTSLERFSEEYSDYVEDVISDYRYENGDDNDEYLVLNENNKEDCLRYVIDRCRENIEYDMEFPCDDLIEKVAEGLIFETIDKNNQK